MPMFSHRSGSDPSGSGMPEDRDITRESGLTRMDFKYSMNTCLYFSIHNP